MQLPSPVRRSCYTPDYFLRLAQHGVAAATLCLGGLVCLTGQSQAAVPQAQRDALVALYNASNGPAWTNSGNWLVGDPCDNDWFGIRCVVGDTAVTRLDLGSNGLNGSLSPLDALVDLESVDLSGNQLGGPIPPLAGLPRLVAFNVHANQLTGTIPSLAGMTNLAYFAVDDNRLSGAVPDLAGLVNLGVFNVGKNRLTGGIPPLSGLARLNYFSVADNGLTGPVPDLAGLSALQNFHVANNRLTGRLPAAPTSLQAGGSTVCPNFFAPATGSTNDLAWNTATGRTPWSSTCAQPVVPVPTLHGAVLAGLGLVLAGVAALHLRRSSRR